MIRSVVGLLALASVAHAEVPADRLRTLSRGVNIDHAVFEQPWSIAEWSDNLALIQRAGFRHIRIFVLDEYLNPNLAVGSNPHIARLDAIVAAALKHHLAVILCVYPKRYLLNSVPSSKTTQYWLAAWRLLAEHYRTIVPDQMFFELVNEPGMDGQHWWPFQEKLRSTVRQIAPAHTLLLTSSPLDAVWSLDSLHLPEDSNVAYTVHLYQPMVFTHQGASWDSLPYEHVKGLNYPPEAANIHAIMQHPEVAGNSAAMRELAQYERQGGTIMSQEIATGRHWMDEHHVPMVVTEFGNLAMAPTDSRAAWFGETRRQVEEAGWGWTVWQYFGSFGIKADLLRGCDAIMQSLGLCR